MKNLCLVAILVITLASGCSRKPSMPELTSADSLAIVQDNLRHREGMDEYFRTSPSSPFSRDTSITYQSIRWFPVDPRLRGVSELHHYTHPETVTVMGTRGEARKQLRYGYFLSTIPDPDGEPTTIKLNVYKFTPHDPARYTRYRDNLSVWFTDETTGKETYEVGRYLDVGNEVTKPLFKYVVDFNKAYNPYCAYSSIFSCAIPREEDHIDIPIRAGEKKYHE
jgi:uncharacterized protein (DUF1684 family)